MQSTALQEREKDLSTKEQSVKEALEKQMMAHREQHQKQISALRDEITDKQSLVDQLKELVHNHYN